MASGLDATAKTLQYERESMTSLYYSEMTELEQKRWNNYRDEEYSLIDRRNLLMDVIDELKNVLADAEGLCGGR